MKKCYVFFLFLLCLFPLSVKAESYGMERFYMNVSTSENGNLEIEEFFQMNGSYNGFERTIHSSNVMFDLKTFTGEDEDFGGSTIYNGTGMTLSSVRGVSLSQISFTDDLDSVFEQIRDNSTLFTETTYATNGDSGVYVLNSDCVKIYNPDNKTGFYLKYTLSDMAILHEDVAEFGWNIFSTEMKESIKDFKVLIHLPNNQNELRAFAHGPLTGNITLLDKKRVLLDVNGLPAYQPLDTRIVFDKSVVPFAVKKSQVMGLDRILKYEGKMADDANQQRESARKEMERKRMISYAIIVFGSFWIIGAVILSIFFYIRFDREYKPTFKGKYFRDFPSDLRPEIVAYLMKKRITTNDLSASILYLIYKKKIGYKKIDKDYKLILLDNEIPLSAAEQEVISFVFDEKTEIYMNQFKKEAKKGYDRFLNLYNSWYQAALYEAENQGFYAKAGAIKAISILYSILGFAIFIYTSTITLFPIFNIVILILNFIFLCYIGTATKRTVTGNEEYHKWLGLKNFMNDFGNFEKRELPQIELWEKYMVYAVTFGVAKKLSKQMELKIAQYNLDTTTYYHDTTFFHDMIILNSIINHDVVSAHSSAMSAQNVANSSSSSSGGFGGGFSSGGGSFGGGGGGGRF